MLAVPYARISSTGQTGGLGLVRQQADPASYCAQRGWELWDGPSYRDAGISAYGGQNLQEGALGRFLADAKGGRFGIEPLALLIEDIDRFSRAFPLAVLPVLVDDVLNAGITIAVMTKGRDISRESIRANQMELIELLMWLGASHEFSEKLSHRISHVHATKREKLRQGQPVTPASAPAWVDLDAADGRWVLNDYANVVRRVVAMAKEGHGLHVIATTLNSEGIPSPGQFRREQWATSAKRRSAMGYRPVQWTSASVRQVLTAPGLIGDRQVLEPGHKRAIREWREKCALLRRQGAAEADLPKHPNRSFQAPQRGYYPAICSEGEQVAILAAMERRKPQTLGQIAHLRWIAQGLTVCPCGGAVGAVCSTKPNGTTYYLRCKGRQKGSGCRQPGVRLLDAQAHLLTRLSSDSFLTMLEERGGGGRRTALAAAITEQENAQAVVDQQEAARRAGEVALMNEGDPAVLGVLARRQQAVEASLEKARLVLRAAQAEVQRLQGRPGERVLAVEAQQAIRSLLQRFGAGADDVVDRRTVRHHLERLGLRVVLDAAGQRMALQIGDGTPAWQPLQGELAVRVLKLGLNQVFYLPATPEKAEIEAASVMTNGGNEPVPARLVAPAEGWSDVESGTYRVEDDGSINLRRKGSM